MELGLRGKKALVTGASKGIGLAIARGLAGEGVELTLAARSGDLLEQAGREMQQAHGVPVHCGAADLATLTGMQQVATAALHWMGQVDILVNNAGAIPAGTVETLSLDSWYAAYELKLWGYIRLATLLLPQMKERRSGVILNIVGNAGKRPSAGYIAGGVANAGLMNFTSGLAQDAGSFGARVVAINPGLTITERMDELIARQAQDRGLPVEQVAAVLAAGIPLGRAATAAEVADVALFLVSERAAMVTGCVVPVEGGATAAL